jgi:hypothetical protein
LLDPSGTVRFAEEREMLGIAFTVKLALILALLVTRTVVERLEALEMTAPPMTGDHPLKV